MTFTQSFNMRDVVDGDHLELERAIGTERREPVVRADPMTNLLEAMRTVEAEIVAAEQEFERSIAALYGKREKLSRDYAELLKAELARVGRTGGRISRRRRRHSVPMPDGDAILAVLERAGVGLATAQIRELAGIPPAVPHGSMSDLMRQLVNDGRVVREGRSSGTRYRIR
jgi:hypothetical protein